MPSAENKKTVNTFALASFLNDFGSDIIYPIWPLFVTNILGANMAILGFIDGLGDALVSISQAISGYLADRIRKRKIFVWLGYLCGSMSRLGYAAAASWPMLIPYRILDRAGKMRGAPRDAMIADVSTKEDRGRNFGLLRTMDNLGAAVGIITCIIFFQILGYRTLFALAAIPSIIGALLIFIIIKEKPSSEIKVYKGITFKNLGKNYKLFLLLSAFFALGSFSYSFLLIFSKKYGFNNTFIPFFYLIFTIVASIFSLPFGKLSDKIGRKPVLMLSFMLWIITCLLAIFVQYMWVVFVIFILYGLHKAALETVQKTLVSELAPENYRASVLGGFQMVIGICALPASFMAGLFWDKINIYVPFYFSMFLTIFSSILLIFVKEN